ncbi:sensor histidine kinase [Pseudaquabacterium rugosum]|uniref:histidine kinase n=1 Tax=Pseudaquabacterium rugosum TaxID=2984194 RepID=A0ABU9BFE4_9BURK
MDTHTREQRSLFGEILDWMLAPLLLLWPMSVALTWLVAQGIANRPYDRDLGEMARAVARQVVITAPAAADPAQVRLRQPELASELLRADDADRVFFQVLGVRGEFVAGDRELPVPEESPAGSYELRFRDDQVQTDPVRVAYLWLPGSGRLGEVGPLVQVAETLDKRATLATEIIKGVIVPQFVVLPLAVLLVWFALARGIRPLNELQQRIRRRASHDLAPLPERDVPEEVAPLVGAINDLLARLDQSMSTQKHFLADAAHQLKTPLAGLRMQAELAQREIDAGQQDPQQLKRSLQQIATASQRAAHMVNQLLAMARAESKDMARKPEPVDLAALARETVRDFVPKAMDLRIDLGYEGPDGGAPATPAAGTLLGQPLLVRELVRNLVDNALQYTPAGGTVTVRVIDDPYGQVAVLQVEDTGPGIPPAERALVLQPFYRALGTNVDGSGLGLAIVQEIVQQHGAELTIDDARPRAMAAAQGITPGALFAVRFRLQPRSSGPVPAPSVAPALAGPAVGGTAA